MAIEVRNAQPSERPAVSRTLALAFADDPVKLHLAGGRELPVERVMPFFDAFQAIHQPHGHVYTTGGFEAAAIWAPPAQWKVPVRAIVRHTPTFLRLYGRRLASNLMILDQLEKGHPREPHYYLGFIGTVPQHQGRGAATALMQPMVDRADREGVGMYLESSKESNVGFYHRFGFSVTEEMRLRRGGPQVWRMWRDPR